MTKTKKQRSKISFGLADYLERLIVRNNDLSRVEHLTDAEWDTWMQEQIERVWAAIDPDEHFASLDSLVGAKCSLNQIRSAIAHEDVETISLQLPGRPGYTQCVQRGDIPRILARVAEAWEYHRNGKRADW